MKKNRHGKTPGELIGKNRELLPIKNPVEIAFVLQDIASLRTLASQMTEKQFLIEMEKIAKKYPKAPQEPFLFNSHYDMDMRHLEKGAVAIEIPKKRKESSITDLLQLVDKEEDKNHLQVMLRRWKSKTLKGLPKDCYEPIENAICHLVDELKDNPEKRAQVIGEFVNAAGECGFRIYETSVMQYTEHVLKVPPTYDHAIRKILTYNRTMYFRSLVPDSPQSVHDYGKLVKAYGLKYAIAGANLYKKYDDKYERSGDKDFDLKKAEMRFLQLYSPWTIYAEFIEPEMRLSATRDKAMAWHKVNCPSGKDPYGYIEEIVEIPPTGGMRIKKEATVQSLVTLEVLKKAFTFKSEKPLSQELATLRSELLRFDVI